MASNLTGSDSDNSESSEGEFDLTLASLNLTGEIQPYRFEPMAQDKTKAKSSRSDSDAESATGSSTDIPHDLQRISNDEWCKCGCCEPMLTVEESTCCKEQEIVCDKMGDLQCILQHEGFEGVCLNKWVLETAYYGYRQEHGQPKQKEIHAKYRYIAYRQFVKWCWGYLGKEIRVPLPSCVVNSIRYKFPSPDYEGFSYPSLQ